jgi:hypothetical protein
MSFVEVLLSHLVAATSKTEMMKEIISQPMLILYYLTLCLFVLVVVSLAGYYVIRFLWELLGESREKKKRRKKKLKQKLVLREGKEREDDGCCFAKGLRGMLLVAFYSLILLFVFYWIFWGTVLASAKSRLSQYLELLCKFLF